MPIATNAPFSWTTASDAELDFLRSLQGNILKGHGRDRTSNIFFSFPEDDATASRAFVDDLLRAGLVTDALAQLENSRDFKLSGKDGGVFGHIALSFHGYERLDADDDAPTDAVFRGGMKAPASLNALGETLEDWSEPFRGTIDGVVLIGDDDRGRLSTVRRRVRSMMVRHGLTIVLEQKGKGLRNAAKEGIEHFGYVDGRSQPLMLTEDLDEERSKGSFVWDPAAPLDAALVKDPGTKDEISFGSYFIFRKLEQRVAAFKLREQQLADRLDLEGPARERAGAFVVGRFEDGTPVTTSGVATGGTPPNNFDYASDSSAARCPFHGHIRKTNPRGSGGFESPTDERKHLMPRRGIPYEDLKRPVHPSHLPEAENLQEFEEKVLPLLPAGGVGLLFMAYNSDIGQQFEFTQQKWANSTGFPAGGPHGIDPVIGLGTNGRTDQKLPKEYDRPTAGFDDDVEFAGFVVPRGGEYFFSPSIEFLRGLGAPLVASTFPRD